MTNRNGTAIQWDSNNLPVCMDASGGACSGGNNWSSFSYAPDKHRYYQTAMINGVSETTVYVGGYEAITSGGITKYRHHLMADGREVAEVDLTNSGSNVNETVSYVLTDHLGSVDVVVKTNTGGTILNTTFMSFSAFGNRREPGTWEPPVGATETQADHNADRYGFTHQEMLDNVGLIHMNGRVYDPNIGRFLSVDPIFAFPTNTQSLNPYSYVLNNPLSLTDPSGYTAACPTGQTCPQDSGLKPGQTAQISYTPTGSHIATTVTATVQKDGSVAISSNNPQMAQFISKAFGGNGAQTSGQGPGSSADLGKTAQNGSLAHNTGGVAANTNAATGSQMVQQQQVDNVGVGKTTVGDLSKVLTNEIGSLSTPKGGDPKELENGEAALANALINNANKARPNEVAPDTGTASLQLVKAMRDAYTNRAHGGVDPVHGRTFYGTSHIPPNRLHSRPIGNSRQTVYVHFGPFKDSTSRLPTYIYIYNDPGH